jgi:O-antigen ligase
VDASRQALSATRPAGSARSSELVEQMVFSAYLAGLAWLPAWYGSNDMVAWGINAVAFPGLAALYEMTLLLRGRGHPVGARELVAPVLLFAGVVGWTLFQTAGWSGFPLANPVWGMAGDALGHPVDGSISVDRDLTNLALLRLLTAASVFWLSLQLCRDAARARVLVASVAAIACCYALYGLVATRFGPVPWLDFRNETGTVTVTSTFVNHNSFATYAGIGLVATAGLILQLYRREVGGPAGSWRYRVATFIEASGREGAVLLGGGFVILVALLMTQSRGGVAATALGLVMVGLLSRRQGSRGGGQPLVAVAVALLAVTATVWVFGGGFIGKLDDQGVGDPSRIAVYLLTIRSIFDAPLSGYGYGTFKSVFPMYRDRSLGIDLVWGQAHDTYLEVLQGLGLVFGLMLLVAAGLLVFRCVRGARRRQDDAVIPQVAAGAAALVGAHSLVDFSLQIQAVALTFIALLGAGVAQSESSRTNTAD